MSPAFSFAHVAPLSPLACPRMGGYALFGVFPCRHTRLGINRGFQRVWRDGRHLPPPKLVGDLLVDVVQLPDGFPRRHFLALVPKDDAFALFLERVEFLASRAHYAPSTMDRQ